MACVADVALSRLLEHLTHTDEPHGLTEDKLELLKEVDAALDESMSFEHQGRSKNDGKSSKTAVFTGKTSDYELTRCDL